MSPLGKTRIEQFPEDLEVIAENDAKFTCSGSTDFDEADNMVVHWEKDDKRISTTENRMTQNYQDNSLTISGTIVRDSGVYTCVITNGLDEDRSYAFLTVKGKNSILVFYVVFTLHCQKFMLSSLYNARSLCFLHCQTSEVLRFLHSTMPEDYVFFIINHKKSYL